MFYKESPRFTVEAIQHFGPNVVRFYLAPEERRCYTIGCYLSPDDASMVESVVTDLRELPQGDKLLVTGGFNSDLEQT